MAYKFIEPNKPIKSGINILPLIDDSYIIESKLDGWRIQAYKDVNMKIVSRKNKTINLYQKTKDILYDYLPDKCCIDCEWINDSRIKAINNELNCKISLVNFLVIIDIIYYNDAYLSNIDYKKRKLKKFNLPIKTIQLSDLSNISNLDGGIYFPPNCLGSEAKEFFNNNINYPISEGIVIKKLKGNMKSSWLKIKYR